MEIDDTTFEDWVEDHKRSLYRLAYWWIGSRLDAEDLVQETFLEAYRSRHNLRDLKLLRPWLVGILRHRHSQLKHRHARSNVLPIQLVEEPAANDIIDLERLDLHQALEQLDVHHRTPVVLFYFEELSYREIAVTLSIPIGTVMSRLSRSRKVLLKKLRPQPKQHVILGCPPS